MVIVALWDDWIENDNVEARIRVAVIFVSHEELFKAIEKGEIPKDSEIIRGVKYKIALDKLKDYWKRKNEEWAKLNTLELKFEPSVARIN